MEEEDADTPLRVDLRRTNAENCESIYALYRDRLREAPVSLFHRVILDYAIYNGNLTYVITVFLAASFFVRCASQSDHGAATHPDEATQR